MACVGVLYVRRRGLRNGDYGSTGSFADQLRAASATRSERSPEARSGPPFAAPLDGPSSAAAAMPRETLTTNPPPGRPPAGGDVAGPAASTGSTLPPWAPT